MGFKQTVSTFATETCRHRPDLRLPSVCFSRLVSREHTLACRHTSTTIDRTFSDPRMQLGANGKLKPNTGSDSVSCPLVTEDGHLSNDILNHATQPSTV